MSESRKRYLAAVRRKKKNKQKKKSNRKYDHTMNMIQPITAPIIVRIPNHDLPLQLLSTPITQITICVAPVSLLMLLLADIVLEGACAFIIIVGTDNESYYYIT
jgi:hypothetical protein